MCALALIASSALKSSLTKNEFSGPVIDVSVPTPPRFEELRLSEIKSALAYIGTCVNGLPWRLREALKAAKSNPELSESMGLRGALPEVVTGVSKKVVPPRVVIFTAGFGAAIGVLDVGRRRRIEV